MQVGQYMDGRPLNYERSTNQFDVGGTLVSVDEMVAYDRAGQISWVSGEMEAWARQSFGTNELPAGSASASEATGKNAWMKRWLRDFFAKRPFVQWLGAIVGAGLILGGIVTPWLTAYTAAVRILRVAVGLAMIGGGILLSASIEVSLRREDDQSWRDWSLMILRATRRPLGDALQVYVLLAVVLGAVAAASALIVVLLGIGAVLGALYLWSQSGNPGRRTQTTYSGVRTMLRTDAVEPSSLRPQAAAPSNARHHYNAVGGFTGQTLDGKHYDATGNYTGQTIDGKHYGATGDYTGQTIDGKHYDPTGNYTGQTVDGKHYGATGDYHGQSIES